MFSLHVRRDPEGPGIKSERRAMDAHVHTLAGRHGLCVLLRLLYTVAA